MTMEKPAAEKLVDEISEELNRLYRAARGGRTPEKKPRDMAGGFIMRIGQAVLSGEYPKLGEAFGVVGYFDLHMKTMDDFDHWAGEVVSRGASIFIALQGEG